MTTITVGAYEAKTHLPRLLAEVEAGGEVVITKHGKPIARLVPVDEPAVDISALIAEIKAARVGRPRVTQDEIRSWIEEGRRW
jgi:prevent-host-death family protein